MPEHDHTAELSGFLDWFRVVVAKKLQGLDRAEATRVATPSGMTMLGVVAHLTWVERMWFAQIFLGEPPAGSTHAQSFDLAPDDTVESVLAAYEAQCEASRRAVASAASLDAPSAVEHWHFKTVSLHWIVVHMIEETARHAGHLDILRELTDGRTAD